MLHLILWSAALLAGAFAAVLVLAIVGIRRGDRCQRLTGQPGSRSEVFARRLLTGSRGYGPRQDAEAGQ